MVYINSRGEVVDETQATPTNIFWRFITFFVLFFKSLIGIEDSRPDKKNDDRGRGGSAGSSGSTGGGDGGGGFFGGGGNKKPGNSDRKFGPRGFKSITDLTPPPPPPMMGGCSGGGCG